MPTNRERILAYLRTHSEGADDDQLSAVLGIAPRQQVNQIARALAQQGLIVRLPDPSSGKLVNRLAPGHLRSAG